MKIKFKYKDQYTHGEWRTQECDVSSLQECVAIYGLDDDDVDYEFLYIEEGEKKNGK